MFTINAIILLHYFFVMRSTISQYFISLEDPDDNLKGLFVEERFVELYGNDVNKSGIWQQVRDVASNELRLKNIAFRATKIVLNPAYEYFEIKKTDYIANKTLKFVEIKNEDINLDIIKFELLWNSKLTLIHITKGFRPDCISFIKELDKPETFRLDKHRCGILNLYL